VAQLAEKDHLRFKILLKDPSYFSEQFADKGRPCSTRKQAYREYTPALLRIGAGGRRVGIQNEGVMRRREAGRKERQGGRGERRERETKRPEFCGGWGTVVGQSAVGRGVAAYSILYYSTIVVYQSHTDRYSVFAIRGNHACRALLAQHQK